MSMGKKKVSFLMGALLSLCLATSAAADVSSAAYSTGKVGDTSYTFTSEVWDRALNLTTQTVEAVSFVKAVGNVDNGYMGANARLYNSAGTMKGSSGMTYNKSRISGFAVYSVKTSVEGTYYAQTAAEFYHGNGYTKFVGYKSPNLVLSQKKLASILRSEELTDSSTSVYIEELKNKTEYSINSNNETYGSGVSAQTIGHDPDLIEAIGTNGLKGYVKSKELEPEVNTIEEALAQNQVNGSVRTISLYDVEGINIIGQFDVVTKYEVIE